MKKRFILLTMLAMFFAIITVSCDKDNNSSNPPVNNDGGNNGGSDNGNGNNGSGNGNGNENILERNIEGSKLTKTYCIDLIRNHWDCSMGAYWFTGQYFYQYYCNQGDRGKVIIVAQGIFDYGINTEKSYYRDYNLYIESLGGGSGGKEHLSVVF